MPQDDIDKDFFKDIFYIVKPKKRHNYKYNFKPKVMELLSTYNCTIDYQARDNFIAYEIEYPINHIDFHGRQSFFDDAGNWKEIYESLLEDEKNYLKDLEEIDMDDL